jgi:hypothetical protein
LPLKDEIIEGIYSNRKLLNKNITPLKFGDTFNLKMKQVFNNDPKSGKA